MSRQHQYQSVFDRETFVFFQFFYSFIIHFLNVESVNVRIYFNSNTEQKKYVFE